jgi:3-hydroxybutyryl-CoA dehydrogenase
MTMSILNRFYNHDEALAIVAEGITDTHTVDALMREAAGFSIGAFEWRQQHQATDIMQSPRLALPLNCPEHTVLPTSIWLAPMESATRDWLALAALAAGVMVEHSGSAPSETALVLCSPLGQDVSSQVLLHHLPAARTIGVDGFLPLESVGRLTVMINPATHLDALYQAYAWLNTTGKAVSAIRDSAGFVMQRLIVTAVALGCQVAQQRLMTPPEIDAAIMALGLGYPQGVLAWCDALGKSRVAQTLAALKNTTGNLNYRPALWLQRRAQLDMSLLIDGVI